MVRRLSSALAAIAAAALFVAMVGAYYVPSFGGTDENGYLVTAKRLATTGDVRKQSSDPYEFISGNWVLVDAKRNLYAAKYPIGYPSLCAVAWRLGGPSAAFWVNPLLSALAVIGIFLLGRAIAGDLAGAFAAILLATNPMHAYFSVSALSHPSSTFFSLWGMYFFWQWGEKGGGWRGMLGAAAMAWAVSARYTEALLALPAAAIIATRLIRLWRDRGENPPSRVLFPFARDLVLILVAALLSFAPLLWQHTIAFGGPLKTGYALCGEATGFSQKWFLKNWPLMLARMDFPGLYLLFPLGLAGMGWYLVHEFRRGLFLALWILPTLLLYTAYYWAPAGEGPSYIRFFVSIFPPLIIAGMGLLCHAQPLRPAWVAISGLLVFFIAWVNQGIATERLMPMLERNTFSANATDLLRRKLPESAVILSDEGPLQFIEFAGNHTLYGQGMFDRATIQRWTKVLENGEPHPFHREKALAIKKMLEGKREPELAEIQRSLIAKHLDAGRRVAMFGNQAVARAWKARLGPRFDFLPVGECLQPAFRPEGEIRSTVWTLTEIAFVKPGTATPAPSRGLTLEQIQERIEQVRYRLNLVREEHEQKYPGAQQSRDRITAMERELGELNGQQGRLMATRRTVLPLPPPLPATNPPSATVSLPVAVISSNVATLAIIPSGIVVRVSGNVLSVTVSNAPPQTIISTNAPSAVSSPQASPPAPPPHILPP
ncbi:MAG: ArnT family glycosyltransferase [Verrucomicrobiia bacterium]